MQKLMYIMKYVQRVFKIIILSDLKPTTWIIGNSWIVNRRQDKKESLKEKKESWKEKKI